LQSWQLFRISRRHLGLDGERPEVRTGSIAEFGYCVECDKEDATNGRSDEVVRRHNELV
jgi:hypothetical protein